MPRRSRRARTLFAVTLGILLGFAVGVPLSYYFQPGWLRALVSLPGYIEMVFRSTLDSLQGKGGGGGSPATVVKLTVAATATIGAFIAHAKSRQPRGA